MNPGLPTSTTLDWSAQPLDAGWFGHAECTIDGARSPASVLAVEPR